MRRGSPRGLGRGLEAAARSRSPEVKKVYDIRKVRRDFPILDRRVGESKLVYLDNAATSQKPRQVLDTLNDYYEEHNANIHRGVHRLAEEAGPLRRVSREGGSVSGRAGRKGLIFTRGTTESINLVAHAWGRKNLREGDEILLTEAEHHSNLVPWQLAARDRRAALHPHPGGRHARHGGGEPSDLGPNGRLYPLLQRAGHRQPGREAGGAGA